MEIDYNKLLWDILAKHFGHHVVIAKYGDTGDPEDVCLECEDCYEVLLDAKNYTTCARDD